MKIRLLFDLNPDIDLFAEKYDNLFNYIETFFPDSTFRQRQDTRTGLYRTFVFLTTDFISSVRLTRLCKKILNEFKIKTISYKIDNEKDIIINKD